jgi:transposase
MVEADGGPVARSPERFGPWKTVFNPFDRWASKGIWQRLFEALYQDTGTGTFTPRPAIQGHP